MPTRIHVPFDRMHCPVKGCQHEGTVPGTKRHVTTTHGAPLNKPGSYVFPPNRTPEGLADWLEADPERAYRLTLKLGLDDRVEADATWEDVADAILAWIAKAT